MKENDFFLWEIMIFNIVLLDLHFKVYESVWSFKQWRNDSIFLL